MAFHRPLLLLLLLLPALFSAGQTSYRLSAHNGSFLTSVPRASFPKDSYSYFLDARAEWQTTGAQDWNRTNNFPVLGIGAMAGNSGSRAYIGAMAAIYGFVDYPLYRTRLFRSVLSIGSGPAWVQKPYDPLTNHKNLLLGSHLNMLMAFEWMNSLRLSARLDLNAGISFTHLSNARIKLPNLGLNIPAYALGLRYKLKETSLQNFPATPRTHSLGAELSLSGGMKQTTTPGGPTFGVAAAHALVTRQVAAAGWLGAGLFFSYDASAGDHYDDSLALNKSILRHAFNTALAFQYEQKLGRLSIPIEVGIYLIEAYYHKAAFEQFGVRYQLSSKLFAGIYLKTHGGIADYLHTGIGLRL